MSEEKVSMRRKRKKQKVTVWKKVMIWIVGVIVICTLIIGGIYLWKADQINGALNALDKETTFTETASTIDDTKGILLIGIDDDGQGNIEQGHTDGLTYVGVNFKTQQVIMMPIYRDARIPIVCDNNREENINRILQQTNLNCLVESTANFLNLPIDYYAQTSTGGFLQAVEKLGTIQVTSEETFCNGEYCFEAGATYDMTADMALKYARYRGATSGLNRANRQMTILEGVAGQCLNDVLGCFDQVSPILGEIVRTNIPVSEMMNYLGAVTGKMTIAEIDVIQGTNTKLSDGWTQIVDKEDLIAKTEHIRTQIFQ